MALGAPRLTVIWIWRGPAAGWCGLSHRHSGGTDRVEAGEIFPVSNRAARSAHYGGSRDIVASGGDSGGISAGKIGGEDRSDVGAPPRINVRRHSWLQRRATSLERHASWPARSAIEPKLLLLRADVHDLPGGLNFTPSEPCSGLITGNSGRSTRTHSRRPVLMGSAVSKLGSRRS